jgi:hypothetical protein
VGSSWFGKIVEKITDGVLGNPITENQSLKGDLTIYTNELFFALTETTATYMSGTADILQIVLCFSIMK